MRKITVLCLVLFISACAKENTDKESCPAEPLAVHKLYTLDAKKPQRLLGQVEVGECFLRIRQYAADTLLIQFSGNANKENDWFVLDAGLDNAKTLTLPNIFYKGECSFTYFYVIDTESDTSKDISCKK